MSGLLDDFAGFLKTPEGQGLLSGVFGYAANAQRGAPINSLGRGGLAGVIGYSNAVNQQDKLATDKITRDYHQMQIDAMRKQLATKDALGKAIMGVGTEQNVPSSPAGPTPGGLSPSSAAAFGAPELTTDNRRVSTSTVSSPASVGSTADRMLEYAKSVGDWDTYQAALNLKMEEKKLAPKYSTDFRVATGPDGKPANYVLGDDGSYKQLPMGVAERLHFANTGAQTVGLNQYTGAPVVQVRNTLSPDAAASNALGWANNRQSGDRLAFDKSQANKPQFKDGYWVVPPQAGQATGSVIETPLSAPPKGSPQALRQSSDKAIRLIDQADSLLDQSTNSYLGTGADMAAQTFGVSTKGAKAAAQLKALEGAIMMAQPRMEGPQSDKDTALYRQMAGMIGDSTVPVDTRRAALRTIRELHQTYASPQSASPQQSGGRGWSATIVK